MHIHEDDLHYIANELSAWTAFLAELQAHQAEEALIVAKYEPHCRTALVNIQERIHQARKRTRWQRIVRAIIGK